MWVKYDRRKMEDLGSQMSSGLENEICNLCSEEMIQAHCNICPEIISTRKDLNLVDLDDLVTYFKHILTDKSLK